MLPWKLKNLLDVAFTTPYGAITALVCLMFFDYLYLLPRHFLVRAVRGPTRPSEEPVPSGLVVIPSLLRARDELEAIQATVGSVLASKYPGDLVVVVSIDGFGEAEPLYHELRGWVEAQQASLASRMSLHLTGTPKRRGKPLAIENGVRHVKELVARGVHATFPKIYFSTDADADLSPHAFELVARRLAKRNIFTGSPKRAVAGNMYVRGNAYWQGLRRYFTVEGQLSIQVAREYLVSNVGRHNVRPFPMSGITGVLYGMWTEIFLEGPRFMGFLQTLSWKDWAKWWLGFPPPKYSESDAKPLPELLAGDTDDTVSAFLAIIARWEDGRFTLDAPRSPLHAFYYLLRGFLVDRALGFEPEARVYTSSPATLKTLWKQRVRWNTARIEVAGRFSSAFLYHWDLGASVTGVIAVSLKFLVFGFVYYVQAPFALFGGSFQLRVASAFGLQLAIYAVWTFLALVMNGEVLKNGRMMLALPLAPLYNVVFNFWTTFTGVVHDVLLFGNVTRFAPEATLIRGGSKRVAMMARVRRVLVLALRSAVWGDVPFGAFWFGWGETPWTPSGFHGWTSGKRPSLLARLRYGTALAPRHEAALPMVNEHERPHLTVLRGGRAANDVVAEESAPPSRRAA